MTAPRLTLPEGGAQAVCDISVVPLQRLAQGGKWRTEAMRSYARPVLLWFTRGQGRITISGKTRGYGPHNAIFLPPGTMHGFDMLGQVFGSVIFLSTAPGLDWPEDALHLRLRDGGRQAELTGLIDSLERELSSATVGADRAIFHRAGLLSVFLERQGMEPDPITLRPRKTASDRLAAAFTALVERDFRTPKSVADYAADLGVTPTHLTRACKQASGQGALQIVADRRLYEARSLLLEENIAVQRIAENLGFRSPAYFTRAFRAGTGLSPTEFRKRR
jgi:AraC-like DNA-binding protein